MKADIYSAMGQEALAKQYAEKAYELKPQLKPIKNGEA